MRYSIKTTAILIATCIFGNVAMAQHSKPKATLNDFYRPFTLSEITPKNMQSWPYYRYTSMNWDEYGIFGTVSIMASNSPG